MRRAGLIPKEEITDVPEKAIIGGYITTEKVVIPVKPAKRKDIKIDVKEVEDA